MASAVRTQKLRPHALSPSEREALVDELYAVQTAVFDGVDRASFARYVIDSSALETWLDVYRNEADEAVGYTALHRFEHDLDGKQVTVFRAEAGTLRPYRGRTAVGRLFLHKMVVHRLLHPWREMYYLGSLVHPSSFRALTRYAVTFWPNPDIALPPRILAFMCALGDDYDLERVDPVRPLVRRVGWITRDTDVERAYWRRCDKPTVRYFVESNPGYVDGDGLLTLLPLHLGGLVRSVWAYLKGRVGRQVEAIWVHTQRIPGLRPRLGPDEFLALFEAQPLLQKLDAETRRGLAEATTVLVLPGASPIFREGDRADAMYLILRGAAYVVVEHGGQELVLDELSAGQVFGEMALLTGQQRSATVRTATATRLLRVDRRAFRALLDASPELGDSLWDLFERRLFNNTLLGLERFGAMRFDDRNAWFDSAERLASPQGETVDLDGPSLLFLASGTAELGQANAWFAVNAPTLIEVAERVRIKPGPRVRLLRLGVPETLPSRTGTFPTRPRS